MHREIVHAQVIGMVRFFVSRSCFCASFQQGNFSLDQNYCDQWQNYASIKGQFHIFFYVVMALRS